MSESSNLNPQELLARAIAAFEAGDIALASRQFQETLELSPSNAEALYFLSVIAYQSGENSQALDLINQAIASRPDAADCHNLHGLILLATGRVEAACNALRLALECEPTFADAANNLGAALEARGDLPGAETAYRRALETAPEFAQAASNLGRVLLSLGRPGNAEDAFRTALNSDSRIQDLSVNIAIAQQRQGNTQEAEETLERALKADTQNAELLRILGAMRYSKGNLAGAESALRDAIDLQPSLVAAHDNLAGVFLDQGRIAEAEASFRHALALNPNDSRVHSNFLLCLNYHETNPEKLFQAHKDWAARHGGSIAQPAISASPPDRAQLRIGYVSGDLRTHSVAYFLEPLLVQRDRKRFYVTCYANLENPDATTDSLTQACDHWRWVAGLDDDQLAAKIRDDNIDILIDLSGHTAGNRLLVFQRHPAPVQATWLGYPNTTGLSAIDYRITDAIVDPPGTEHLATESLVRLDDGFLCYQPPADAPPVAARNEAKAGHVTFGSFNTLRKIAVPVIETWVEILREVPAATLLLKARSIADPATATRIINAFEERGIAPERIILRGPVTASSDHLAAYADLDIALDPFPYNGTTTTCEALWMGVPVITLTGNRHAGRVGTSLLSQIGLERCIANSRKDYIEIATSLANDGSALRVMRTGLRNQLAASSLCDAAGFCRHMEDAYEFMWQAHHVNR